jgi:hypothetical protein
MRMSAEKKAEIGKARLIWCVGSNLKCEGEMRLKKRQEEMNT